MNDKTNPIQTCQNDIHIKEINIKRVNSKIKNSKNETSENTMENSSFENVEIDNSCNMKNGKETETILVLYFSTELLMSEDSSTALFHGWTSLCYFMPLFGAILADSFYGKFVTIFILSVVYLLGNLVLSAAASKQLIEGVRGQTWLSVFGLILIAIGTGGIKPCVAALGGDQFDLPRQEKQLSKFFLFFYFSINLGALLSTLVTPILRDDVTCFGRPCFALAFGVPAVLMLLALVLFALGAPQYRIVSPEGNLMVDVVKCTSYAFYRRVELAFKRKSLKSSIHWLRLAEDRYSSTLIKNISLLQKVLILYLPLPFFWALYDQQSSRWIFQANKMSGDIGFLTIKPDQLQILNPLLVMMLIPLFNGFIYPCLSHFKLMEKPLRRMLAGGLMSCVAFAISGYLQIAIENNEFGENSTENLQINILNALPCEVYINSPAELNKKIFAFDLMKRSVNLANDSMAFEIHLKADGSKMCKHDQIYSHNFDVSNKKNLFLVLNQFRGNLTATEFSLKRNLKRTNSNRQIIDIVDLSGIVRLSSLELRTSGKPPQRVGSKQFASGVSFTSLLINSDTRYELFFFNPLLTNKSSSLGAFASSPSSSLLFIYKENLIKDQNYAFKIFDYRVNSIHMLWLFPQYLVMSVAEILFIVTGLEFSFKYAPPSMKSVVQACWLITTAFGSLIVVVIAENKFFPKQSVECFVFAILMAVDMLFFFLLSLLFEKEENTLKNTDELLNILKEENGNETERLLDGQSE